MKIRTNKEIYFHQVLSICSGFPPYNKLTKTELKVLGELMLCKAEGWKPLLNKQTREKVAQNTELTQDSLRNNLTQLRVKGLLIDDEIPEKYLIKYLTAFNFEFYEQD